MPISPTFQCPQQSKLKLPLSRLNDGVCDCCDGADESAEWGAPCDDICDEVLASERAARATAENNFKIGSKRRFEELEKFKVLVENTLVEIRTEEDESNKKQDEINRINSLIEAEKAAFKDKRHSEISKVIDNVVNVSKEAGDNDISGLLSPLTKSELSSFIQLTCQIAGEMEGSSNENTCVPLRLAGVDIGILWKDENFDATSVERFEDAQLQIELVDENSQGGDKIWSQQQLNAGNGNKRRRLDEDFHDDDDFDYDEEDDFDDEEYDDEYERNHPPVRRDNSDDKTITYDEFGGENIEKVKTTVEGSFVSLSRMDFLAHADALIKKIEPMITDLKKASEEKDGEDKEEEARTDGEKDAEEKEDENVPDISQLEKIILDLKKRERIIKRGFQYALSANILLNHDTSNETDAINDEQVRIELLNLAAITLMHSQISTKHVWYLLNSILPELLPDSYEPTCTASPFARICPARIIEKPKGNPYPPPAILSAGEILCTHAVDEATMVECNKDNISDEIPNNIAEGYFGYHQPTARTQDDFFHTMFNPLETMFSDSKKELERQRQTLENEISESKRKIKDLEKTIGGREQNELSGELHMLKVDPCYAVIAGKYEYEVCVDGRASQKDKGSKGSGTGLGNWKGMSIDKESGERIMKWTNGQKCWNGPARSATAFITCGPEMKLLSAEEPETCTYIMEMESYIACDEDFYERHIRVT